MFKNVTIVRGWDWGSLGVFGGGFRENTKIHLGPQKTVCK